MKVGVIISNNEPEILFNGVRFANFCLDQGDDVTLFFNARAVEYHKVDTPPYKIEELVKTFVSSEGVLLV